MEELQGLLSDRQLLLLNELINKIDSVYDMERTWNKAFGDWVYEYKYRRGGKTLCTFYVKQGTIDILIIYGKAECEKFDILRNTVSESLQSIFNSTKILHDGKWLWIPIDERLCNDDIITMLKIKRKPNRK